MRVPLLYGRCKHRHRPVVDPGGPGPLYFWTKLMVQRAEKFFFQDQAPPPTTLCQGLDDGGPPLSEGLDPPLQIEELLLTNETLQLPVT